MKRKLTQAILLFIFSFALAACSTITCQPARDDYGRIARSREAVRLFRASTPCPATGLTKGACPGYHVDHIKPLCACGADEPGNMQWLSKEDHKVKTKADVRGCRR